MKYLLGIPFVNREDLLVRAVESVKPLWPNAVIIDNSERGLRRSTQPIKVLTPPVPLTFSQTMNLLLRQAAEVSCDALIYMHNDAEAVGDTAERFLAIIAEAVQSGRRWGVAFTAYDTLAALNMVAARKIGPWDTILPQYFADNDYYRRIRLAGFETIETGLPVIHANGGSNTLKHDTLRTRLNHITFPLYQSYYTAKWGGTSGQERYTRPFNSSI
jgi:hypothetical protein